MLRIFAAVAMLGLALAGTARAQDEAFDTPADWIKRPTTQDIMSVWPSHSMAKSGRAVVECMVNTRGVLFDCKVAMEKPKGSGFGAAALALTPQFLMKPAMKGGVPVVSGVSIPISFTGRDAKSELANPTVTRTVLAQPVWTEAPSQAAVAASYPSKAAAQRLSGHVTLICAFNKQARPGACTTVQERPAGMGFGKAARSLAGQFYGPTTRADGTSIKGMDVQMMFSFAPEVLDGTLAASRPLWLDAPTKADLLAAFPAAANKAGVTSARVVYACTIAPGGRLEACALENEEPKGFGVGAAMLQIAPKFRLSPWSQDGMPMVGGRIRVPIRYAIEDEAEAAPSP